MKNRTDKILPLLFAVSITGYFFCSLCYRTYLSPVEFAVLWYAIPAIPAFCLQLLLCRNIKQKRLAALHAVLLTGWCLLCLIQTLLNTGWDALSWAIFLGLSIAPVAGCVLAWAVYGCWRLYRKGDICVP